MLVCCDHGRTDAAAGSLLEQRGARNEDLTHQVEDPRLVPPKVITVTSEETTCQVVLWGGNL